MKFISIPIVALLGISSPTNADEPFLRGVQHTTFDEQAAEASSILAACEDPNCGGTAKEGEQCSRLIGWGVFCETGLYCVLAYTCDNTYESGAAFCCPSGTSRNGGAECEPNPACNTGPPAPPSPPVPPPPPAPTPTPPIGPVTPGSWNPGCPDGYWGPITHDHNYEMNKDPFSGSWTCKPINNEPKYIAQDNVDKFKSGGDTQAIMIDGKLTTVQKSFGHSLDTEKIGCGECWLIRPAYDPEQRCYSPESAGAPKFGTCSLKDPENPPVILLMSVSEKKDYLHRPEMSTTAKNYGLGGYNNDGCNDLQDGKWPFQYQPYVNEDLGCIPH